jgi:glyoxylase-like metal-dependent hydrolase (beta-lactamase superfamily II)
MYLRVRTLKVFLICKIRPTRHLGFVKPDLAHLPVGQVEQLEPLVARLLAPNPSPFTWTGTQSYLVGDARGLAIIDPGPDDPAHLTALITAIGRAPLWAIICTHSHRDHSPASRPLKAATGAPIIGCAPLLLDDHGPRADASFDRDYAPDQILGDGQMVAGEGWTLTAVATPGHTSNHLCFRLDPSGALFTGDHVMGWSTTVIAPPDGDMAAYLASLDKLLGRDDRIYYPAHGDPITQPQRLVRSLAGHRKSREGQISRLLAEAPRSIPELVARMYVGVDRRLHGAAGLSVTAHLLDMEARGLVAKAGERWQQVA